MMPQLRLERNENKQKLLRMLHGSKRGKIGRWEDRKIRRWEQ
jgi:hypothetical protein